MVHCEWSPHFTLHTKAAALRYLCNVVTCGYTVDVFDNLRVRGLAPEDLSGTMAVAAGGRKLWLMLSAARRAARGRSCG